MKNHKAFVLMGAVGVCSGCAAGGANVAAESSNDSRENDVGANDEVDDGDSTSPSSDFGGKAADAEAGGAKEPEFAAGMSVVEATNAVPDSIQRVNIEQEALAAPLMDPELYEPCELQGHHHFKVRVAVWDGRAVGLDVTTQPSDQKLETCLKAQLSSVEWKDKAKSINTVEYSY